MDHNSTAAAASMQTSVLQVHLGTRKSDTHDPVVWSSDSMINAHWVLFGNSGSGKTHRLRNIISQLVSYKGVRVFVFDVAGDMELPESYTSTVTFSEQSPTGVNALMIDPDRNSGGVRRRINTFIGTINKYSRKLGEKQENVMSQLLEDYFNELGYYADRPASWKSDGKQIPTLLGAMQFTKKKIKSLIVGSSGKVHSSLANLCGKYQALDKQFIKELADRDKDLIQKYREECDSSYKSFIYSIETGRELEEFIKYDSLEVLKSVYKRLENLYKMGVFKETPPGFDKSKSVWNFDIFNVSKAGQGFIVELYLERIYAAVRQRGLSQETPHTFIIIDEAQMFVDLQDNQHIINVLFREARKFGVGMILASQNYAHFPEDVATLCAAKVVLGVDEKLYEKLGKMLGLKAGRFHYIQLRRTGLVQFKRKDVNADNRFMDVLLC